MSAAAAAAPPWGGWLWLALPACVPLLALLVDRLLGEPPVRWHPVVWMGHALGWAGKRVAPLAADAPAHPRWRTFWQAALIWCALAAVCVLAAALLHAGAQRLPPWAQALALALLLKPLLAWAMLRREVMAVEQALAQSLPDGRARLAWLVSRDVSALTPAQVRESAIESLAENLNDSLVAPLFWYALLGLPGAALYRFANTADAMWGYPGERGGRHWQWAGKWAARADDALSWLPARLTALLIILLAGPRGWRTGACLPAQARQTPSPNSGWPMAAMAMALGVQLGKPGVYALNPRGRTPGLQDTARACALAGRVAWTVAGLASLALVCAQAAGC